MARIGFLGTGEIASAMVETVAGAGHDIIVSLHNERVSAALLSPGSATDLARLRAGLSTEGGLNQHLSRTLAGNGTLAALEAGLDGLRERLQLPPKNQ